MERLESYSASNESDSQVTADIDVPGNESHVDQLRKVDNPKLDSSDGNVFLPVQVAMMIYTISTDR